MDHHHSSLVFDEMMFASLKDVCIDVLLNSIRDASQTELEALLQSVVKLPIDLTSRILLRCDLDLDLEISGNEVAWKRVYFEWTVRTRLESFDPAQETIGDLQRLLAFARRYVQTLEIRRLPSHLDLEFVFEALGHGPAALTLRYCPGEIGMNYERTLFGMKLSDSRSLARVLEGTELLTSLDIGNNWIDDDKLRVLCSGLLDNISLTELNLSKNRISDRGARALAKVFQNNPTLIHCNLSDNCIFMDGARALARAIKTNKSLRCLDLSLNRLNDEGTKLILDAASRHPSLSTLKIAANHAGLGSAEALCRLLKKNTSLTSIDMSANPLKGREEEIHASLTNNSSVHNLSLLLCDLKSDVKLMIDEMLVRRAETLAAQETLALCAKSSAVV